MPRIATIVLVSLGLATTVGACSDVRERLSKRALFPEVYAGAPTPASTAASAPIPASAPVSMPAPVIHSTPAPVAEPAAADDTVPAE